MTGILNIQFQSVLGNKEINLERVEGYIKTNKDKPLDLVVLPEFFSTGIDHQAFVDSPEDTNGGETIGFIRELAKKYNTNIIAGSIIEKSDDKLYNTSFIIDRTGKILDKYRKIHLFNYLGGTEGERITAGDRQVVVDFDFGKVGVGICYDIRYPLHYKNLVKSGAEIVVLPTAWIVADEIFNDTSALKSAQDLWVAINRTRAFDNLVYTVSCNQWGNKCIGKSLVVAPSGMVLSDAENNQGGFYTDIDLDIVKAYKSIYPISHID